MDLRQQIVEAQVARFGDDLDIPADPAFLRLAHFLLTSQSPHAFDPDDLVDGGGDKQIDIVTITEHPDAADVYVIQGKNTDSFSSNALVQMNNGLSWLFEKPRAEIKTLGNHALQDKIQQYRSVQSAIGPSNIRVHVAFVTNGDSAAISPEFKQELRAIDGKYNNETFESFSIEPIGADELVSLLNAQERRTRNIDADIRMRYDANTPSLIRYHAGGLKGFVCTVPASEIARIVNDDKEGAVFDLNLRRFLGARGSVNGDILQTCTSIANGYEFWFLNNGLTIVCDAADAVTDPDNPHLKLRNLQIVNGCQTATTLAVAQKEGTLAADTRVLVRVYEAADSDLVGRIVLTTNNQNKITTRDLRANDQAQVDMERAFELDGYHYERKARQYDRGGVDASKILANETVARWYLAIAMGTPADARARKYKIWGEHYPAIFNGQAIENYLVATLIGRRVEEWLHESGLRDSEDEVERMIAKRGSFHVGRLAALSWLGQEVAPLSKEHLRDRVSVLENGCAQLNEAIENGVQTLHSLLSTNPVYREDVDRSLKTYELDADIRRSVHESGSRPQGGDGEATEA